MTPPDPLGALVVPAAPTPGLPGAAIQPGADGDPAAAEEFELLVSRLLAGTGQATASTPGTVPAETATSPLPATDAGSGEEPDDDDGTGPESTAAGVLPETAAWLLPPALVRAAIASAPPATTGSAPAPREPDAPAPTGATGSVPAPARPGVTPAPDGATPPDEGRPVAAPPVAVPDTGQSTPTTLPATSPSGAPTMSPVGGAAAMRADAPTSAPTAVTRQVFPEVVRLAASGEATATQRVTLLLRPESLGEVRVVLTTRHGELQVSLSAGGDTHRALLEGTPELRRLLETIGSPDARVVVRDLPGSPLSPQASASRADTSTGTPTGTPTDLSGGPGAGTGHPGDRPDPRASGRESTTATDGTHDAATPQRRTESVTRARTGLDVTM